MSAGDKDAKTEAPTPKRKKDAKKEGNIPRSPDLTSWVGTLVALQLIKSSFSIGEGRLRTLWTHAAQGMAHPEQASAMRLFGEGMTSVLITVSPLVLGMMAVGIVGNLAQVGWSPSSKKLKPNFKRLNPLPGLKNMFSAKSFWELGKSVGKLSVLGYLGWKMLIGVVPALTAQGQMPMGDVLHATVASALTFVRNAAVAGLVIAALDWGMQKKRIRKQLMMTKQEVKDESRQSEGDPHVKAKIREKQMSMSRLRMMADVAKSDVVIVNPIHFAVALKYEQGKGAPRVVAKGADDVALAIREHAEENGVAVVEDVPLARALHAACKLNDEIPPEMFEAVARILAFIMALKAKPGGLRKTLSGEPHKLPVAMRYKPPADPTPALTPAVRALAAASA